MINFTLTKEDIAEYADIFGLEASEVFAEEEEQDTEENE